MVGRTPIKYEKIPYLETIPEILTQNVEIYEKIDGGNAQMRSVGDALKLATRSGDHSLRSREHAWFGKFQHWAHSFYGAYLQEYEARLPELLPEHLVIFGEWTATEDDGSPVHTIQYKPEFMDQFFLIDVYDIDQHRHLPYEKAKEAASLGGLLSFNTVRLLHRGPIDMPTLETLLKGSDYLDGDKEGLVIKDYANQQFAKYLNPEYRELFRDKEGIDAYLTPARLRKVANRFHAANAHRSPTMNAIVTLFIDDIRREAPQHVRLNEGYIEKWVRDNAPATIKKPIQGEKLSKRAVNQ